MPRPPPLRGALCERKAALLLTWWLRDVRIPFFPVALPSTEPSKTLPQSFLHIKWGFPKAFLQLGLLGLG